jgi:hypothetical protein
MLARLRHADGPRKCLLIEQDRTRGAHDQNDAFDPEPTSSGIIDRSKWYDLDSRAQVENGSAPHRE